jgi:hypothetical protein
MNNQDKENLKQLFEKFVSSEEAEEAAEDIRKAEQILDEYSAPEPDSRLLARIKAEVTAGLQQNKAVIHRKMVYKIAVAAAAAVIILAAVSIKLSEKSAVGPQKITYASVIPRTIWESEQLADDDEDLANLTAEFEDIESEVLAVHQDKTNGNGDMAELEIELTEIDSDFWKG